MFLFYNVIEGYMRKSLSFIGALFVIGFGGIVAQTILLRECLIVFSGNELSIGVIIGSWVIWEAIGAYFGGKWNKGLQAIMRATITLLILFSLFLPASIYIVRIFKVLAGIPSEMGIGIILIFVSSFLMMMPTGLLHGALFTLSCSVYGKLTTEDPSAIGKVYFYEMCGTIIGGVVVSYLFIPYLNAFQIAIGLMFLEAIASLFLSATFFARTWKNLLLLLSLLLVISSLVLIAGTGADRIHQWSVQGQWHGKHVIDYKNSYYQNIVVVENENQHTFFFDGIPLITMPVPDIAYVEEFVHFAALSQAHPENILVLHGGAGGVISEILKYPTVKRIDYVEIDPLLLHMIKRYPTPLTLREFSDPRVHLHYADGRIFVKKAPVQYDIVFLGVALPYTLQTNRFFTQEFFGDLKKILSDQGTFVLTATGSLAYYSKELKNVNACLYQTLKAVFPYTLVIPGDLNLFLSSKSSDVLRVSASPLFERLTKNHIETKLINLPEINYRLNEEKRQWFFSSIENAKVKPNKDFAPEGLFYNIVYQNVLFSPSLKHIFEEASAINLPIIIVSVALLFILFFFLSLRRPNIVIPFAIGATGFTAMMLELLLIFAFQVLYGYVFYEIGMLITMLMAGMAMGNLVVTNRLDRIKKGITLFVIIEGATILFVLVLFLAFSSISVLSSGQTPVTRLAFFFLLFIAGFLTGMEFPLANKIYMHNKSVGKTAGIIYSSDLAGGWIGGIFGGFLLLPVLGFAKGCIMLILLKASSLILLLTHRRK